MGTYRGIAEANEEIVADGWYTAPSGRIVQIGDDVAAACAGTVLYGPDSVPLEGVVPGGVATRIEVTGESSMSAARRLYDEGAGRIAVLNFASARNPGGGYLGGARAQEEDLCRVSALYTTLRQVPDYYAAHRESRDLAYSHRVIYSPDVPVYRDVRYQLLDAPYQVSFLTSPAPNAGAIARDTPTAVANLPDLLTERAARVLAAAVRNGCRALVLGAWGCGVFRNDPAQVASAFERNLTGDGAYAGVFERIVFAVLDTTAGQANLTAFRSAFPVRTIA